MGQQQHQQQAGGPGPDGGGAVEVADADRQEAARLSRGAAQVLPEAGLAQAIARARHEGRPLRVKLGVDPTGDRLTLGHGVVLRTLRRFVDAGHRAVLILGTVTGQVGDPSGRSATRPVLSADDATRHADGYLQQVLAVLGDEGVEVVRNGDWLGAMTLPEVVAEARHLTVAQLVEREDVARRLADGRPVSLSELLYPLLQGYDSVAVRADVELGGTDQTFNLLVGRELQRAHGQPPQVVLTVPLLVGTDGSAKMSKSLGNFVALGDPPAEQFGKVMSIPDHLVGDWALLCTDLDDDEVAGLARAAAAGGPPAGAAKRRLAHEVVRLSHDAAAADAAATAFDTRFRERAVPEDVPTHRLGPGTSVHLPALLVETGLAASRGQARRHVADRAVRLDGEPVPVLDLDRDALAGRVLAVGRRRAVRLQG